MTVLKILEWVITSNTVVTSAILITFTFGLLLSLLKGGNRK